MSSQMLPGDPNNEDRKILADSKIDPVTSIRYWNNTPATVSAMLGNLGVYPWYSRIELQGSMNFLAKVRRSLKITEKRFRTGVDCGAGVGRVTEGLLLNVCDTVDVVEPVEKFVSILQKEVQNKEDSVIGDIYVTGLESWSPVKKYDLIWCQWCVGHITDVQLVEYISRCRAALTEKGIMVIKENISTDPNGDDMYDDLDSSVTRSDEKFRKLFRDADMTVLASEIQTGFPKKYPLLPVRSYALRPKRS